MAKVPKERIIAWFFAAIFIISSSALTIAVVLDNIQRDKQSDATTNQQAATTNANQTEDTNMLQGTQLEGFTPVADIPQLQAIDTVAGTGDEVKSGDTVTVDYTGALASNGTIFQSSKDSGQPISFPLSGVIKGWTDGVPGMKVGGTRRLLIPSAQAYGSSAQSGIPADSDLVFDITLHAIGE